MSHDATNWAVKVRGISCTEARVLWHLADCHNPVFGCYPKQDYLSNACEIDERSVRRALVSLRGKGLVNWVEAREGKNRKANRYSLAFEEGFRAQEDAGTPENEPDNLSGSNAASTGQNAPLEPDSGGAFNRTPESSIEPVREPVKKTGNEREGAGEPGQAGDPSDGAERAGPDAAPDGEHDPARLLKRVKALEMGRAGNPWPGALGSSTTWAAKQFEKLTINERRVAEDRRDAYLAECEARRVKPVALGVYLRDRKFLDVAPERVLGARRPERIPMAPFGPVWAGKRALHLLDGPVSVDIPLDVRAAVETTWARLCQGSEAAAASYLRRKGITVENGRLVFPDGFETAEQRRRTLEQGYPEVNQLHEQAKRHETTVTEACYGRLADLCEPVPVDGPVMAAWIAHEDRMGWPSVPDPGRMRVVYYPKGGPDGLKDFELAARAAMADGRKEDRGNEHAA